MKNNFKINDTVYCFFNNHPSFSIEEDEFFEIHEWIPPFTDVLEAYLDGILNLDNNIFKIIKINDDYITLDNTIAVKKNLIYSPEEVNMYITNTIAPEAEKYRLVSSKYMEVEKLLKDIFSLYQTKAITNHMYDDIHFKLKAFFKIHKCIL